MSRRRNKPDPDAAVLDRLDAAALCRISPPVFDEWIEKGIVPGQDFGTKIRHYRVARTALLAWLGQFGLPKKAGE